MITPYQFRMARAVIGMTARKMGAELGITKDAIQRFECGETPAISMEVRKLALEWFNERQVFFGPRHGVCFGEDIFE